MYLHIVLYCRDSEMREITMSCSPGGKDRSAQAQNENFSEEICLKTIPLEHDNTKIGHK